MHFICRPRNLEIPNTDANIKYELYICVSVCECMCEFVCVFKIQIHIIISYSYILIENLRCLSLSWLKIELKIL